MIVAKSPKTGRGGKRKGAGRPPLQPKERKAPAVRITFPFRPEVADRLERLAVRLKRPRTAIVADLILAAT